MSVWSININGDGIGKSITGEEKKGKSGYSIITIDGEEFELYNVSYDDDGISFDEASCEANGTIIIRLLAQLSPDVEISCWEHNHDGHGFNFKCGVFDGEFKEWDFKEWNLYDILEDDFFSLSHNYIKGKGIGKAITYEEIEDTVEDELFQVSIGDEKFKLKKVSVTDDSFRFSEGAIVHSKKILELLLDMFPEIVFTYVNYEEDGNGYGYRCGIFDGEYKNWDLESGDIDNELKDFM